MKYIYATTVLCLVGVIKVTTEQKIAREYLNQLYFLSIETSVEESKSEGKQGKNNSYLDLQSKYEDIFSSIAEEEKILLRLRYIYFCSWQEVQERMFISESTRKRKHRKALSQVYKVLKKLDLIDPLRGQV